MAKVPRPMSSRLRPMACRLRPSARSAGGAMPFIFALSTRMMATAQGSVVVVGSGQEPSLPPDADQALGALGPGWSGKRPTGACCDPPHCRLRQGFRTPGLSSAVLTNAIHRGCLGVCPACFSASAAFTMKTQ